MVEGLRLGAVADTSGFYRLVVRMIGVKLEL